MWVAFAFSGVQALERAFFSEKDRGSLEGLLLLPVSRYAVYLGKLLGSLGMMLAMESALVPLFAGMLHVPLLSWELALTVLLATAGFATLGTLFSALLADTRGREIMLPLLFFPMVAPVLLGAVRATSSVIAGDAAWRPLVFLGACDAALSAVCPWLLAHALDE